VNAFEDVEKASDRLVVGRMDLRPPSMRHLSNSA
jgi:hypothetical protein